jgi:hypothetical protein
MTSRTDVATMETIEDELIEDELQKARCALMRREGGGVMRRSARTAVFSQGWTVQ